MTREDFDQWNRDPMTLAVMELIHQEVRSREEAMGNGSTIGADPAVTAMLTARAVGEITAFKAFLNLRFEDVAPEQIEVLEVENG